MCVGEPLKRDVSLQYSVQFAFEEVSKVKVIKV